ncbi:glycosyl hydrolase family 2 [Microcella alkaliphila]|uniref:Glycosyl hydrolase family 2 n=1 Tax=Microcella alkaliphila TaxID=279828 RepID=A0A4Q7TK99_9MICO|nr:glycoside hydrolase family 2 TIM barrel-domain containing protein [Microcella alkaliphila]RZT60853.1 glycosyl hydrolase family 2 [Microcella alkaliphila]
MHTVAHIDPALRARHPRPRAIRGSWVSLDGEWEFASESDPQRSGEPVVDGRPAHAALDRIITVPFPPESELSGIGDTAPHDRLWYRRIVTRAELEAAGAGNTHRRVLAHFGAVDYRCRVWVGDRLAGEHTGGHTPFTFDITDLIDGEGDTSVLVCVEDHAADVEQPRGKQDWQAEPHSIWYHRTSGIWQSVWLEAVSARYIDNLQIDADIVTATVTVTATLAGAPRGAGELAVQLELEGRHLGSATATVEAGATSVTVVCPVPELRNGQAIQDLVWSPEHPRLVDVAVELRGPDDARDALLAYTGLRTVGVADGRFLLNDQPREVRAVLSQGFWAESHLAAPDDDALRREVQLILDLGFTTARIHEKVEDPRFLYWADRLGLMLWVEMPSAYAFTPRAVERTLTEWLAVVARDRSNPSVVAWVPLNESWGVQLAAHDPAQIHFIEAMYRVTKALDPHRPVISNDGWEHATSDLLTVHDYTVDPEAFRRRYADANAARPSLAGIGPAGRRMHVGDFPATRSAPIVVSEFGGVTYAPDAPAGTTWGYAVVDDSEAFAELVGALLDGVRGNPAIAGWCYTQLTDTLQEANGLVTADRQPKLPIERMRALITGEGAHR